MANRDELEAMGISNNGMNNNNFNNSINKNSTNGVAQIIKTIAIITGIIGVIFGIYAIDGLNLDEGAIIIIVASVISAIFIYSLGEIIQLLQDIKNK